MCVHLSRPRNLFSDDGKEEEEQNAGKNRYCLEGCCRFIVSGYDDYLAASRGVNNGGRGSEPWVTDDAGARKSVVVVAILNIDNLGF